MKWESFLVSERREVFRILVTGSRQWTDTHAIYAALVEVDPLPWRTPLVIHGACPTGADAIADQLAREYLYWDVEKYPADWSIGKAAGPQRNQRMVDAGADVCLAFISPPSRGTLDTVARCDVARIPVRKFYPESNRGK